MRGPTNEPVKGLGLRSEDPAAWPTRSSPNLGLPKLTHLQGFVIGCLADGQKKGREIREELAKIGEHFEGPKFYMLMDRLREAGLVYQRKIPLKIGEQTFRECVYKASALALRERAKLLEFYRAQSYT